jgi:hypothetical protein
MNPSFDLLACNALPGNFSGPAELTPSAPTSDCPYDAVNLTEEAPPGNDRPDPGTDGTCGDAVDNDGDTKTDADDDDCRGKRNVAPSGNPDTTTNLIWPRGSANYAQDTLITTTGGAWTVARGTLGEGTSAIPEGQVIGGLISTTTLGLAANPCSNVIVPNFIFWNASTDNVGDVVVAQPEGTSDRWLTIMDDDDGFAGQADADSLIVTKYPDFLNRMFDPDGSGVAGDPYSPVRPWARYAGGTQVPPGGDWQALEVLVFDPGTLPSAFAANPGNSTHPYSRLPDDVWVNITVLNDPSIVASSVSAISDFCTELAPPLMTLGNPGGNARLTAPAAAGTNLGRVYTLSIRDTDGDGLENAIDTCPFTANIEDPYTDTGVDADMIDPACDPTPTQGTKYDATLQEDGATSRPTSTATATPTARTTAPSPPTTPTSARRPTRPSTPITRWRRTEAPWAIPWATPATRTTPTPPTPPTASRTSSTSARPTPPASSALTATTTAGAQATTPTTPTPPSAARPTRTATATPTRTPLSCT